MLIQWSTEKLKQWRGEIEREMLVSIIHGLKTKKPKERFLIIGLEIQTKNRLIGLD